MAESASLRPAFVRPRWLTGRSSQGSSSFWVASAGQWWSIYPVAFGGKRLAPQAGIDKHCALSRDVVAHLRRPAFASHRVAVILAVAIGTRSARSAPGGPVAMRLVDITLSSRRSCSPWLSRLLSARAFGTLRSP
jgi:hypothetical protein